MSTRRLIRAGAKKHGVSTKVYRAELQAAIDTAWESPTPMSMRIRNDCSRTGDKPTIGEYISCVANIVSSSPPEIPYTINTRHGGMLHDFFTRTK